MLFLPAEGKTNLGLSMYNASVPVYLRHVIFPDFPGGEGVGRRTTRLAEKKG